MTSSTAFKTFSLVNDIFEVSPQDEIYAFDVEANKRINREAPWDKEYVSDPISSEQASMTSLIVHSTSNHARSRPSL
jgi:COP9 signalosome complex subunit 5